MFILKHWYAFDCVFSSTRNPTYLKFCRLTGLTRSRFVSTFSPGDEAGKGKYIVVSVNSAFKCFLQASSSVELERLAPAPVSDVRRAVRMLYAHHSLRQARGRACLIPAPSSAQPSRIAEDGSGTAVFGPGPESPLASVSPE